MFHIGHRQQPALDIDLVRIGNEFVGHQRAQFLRHRGIQMQMDHHATAAAFPPKRHSPHSSRPGRGPAGCGAQSAGGAALNPEPGQAHYILDEMVMNGCMVETNRLKILTPVQLLDKIEAAT